MRRSHYALAVCFALLISSSVSAYDTGGKFGMGIRMTGTPVILFSNMKIGLNNFLTLEPSVGFNQIKLKWKDSVAVYDHVKEELDTTIFDLTDRYNMFIASLVADMKPLRFEKSNFVIKAGGMYWRGALHDEYVDRDYGSSERRKPTKEDETDAIWAMSVKGGLGIEHFFTDHMSVYAGFLSSFSLFGSEESYYDYVSATSVGNQFAELSFVWYLK